MRLSLLCPATILILAAPSLGAQSKSNPAVDRIFAEWDKPTSPGCAVGAIQNNRYLYQRGYGMANLDYDIPNAPEMVYYVGSDSKQFTAASIALLSLQGRLSLDDDIRKYFPELPDYGTPITIRHLIHHMSGIRDIYSLMSMRGDKLEDVFSDSAALSLIVRQKGLGFKPGDAYSYSNSGYFLLAQLIKRVTGQPLREFADAQIFQPLGMTHTNFHDDPGHVMKGRAMSYEKDGKGGFRISYLQNFDKVGAGGLYSTIDDLRKWDDNFYTHQVGGDALQKIIHTRGILNNGDTLAYAFGNNVGKVRGLRVTEHGGSMMGYKAYVLRFPDQHLSVLTTCNLGAIDPGPLAHAVAAVFLGDKMSPETPRTVAQATARQAGASSTSVALTSADLAGLVGDYFSDDLGVTYRVHTSPEGRLLLDVPGAAPSALLPVGSGAFRTGSMNVRFDRPASGAATVMILTVSRIGEMRLQRR
jgi:CubicO group peptidase (beta-lactamase class C family)